MKSTKKKETKAGAGKKNQPHVLVMVVRLPPPPEVRGIQELSSLLGLPLLPFPEDLIRHLLPPHARAEAAESPPLRRVRLQEVLKDPGESLRILLEQHLFDVLGISGVRRLHGGTAAGEPRPGGLEKILASELQRLEAPTRRYREGDKERGKTIAACRGTKGKAGKKTVKKSKRAGKEEKDPLLLE